MTLALETTGRPQKQAMSKAGPYRLRVAADGIATLRYWHRLDALAIATPFQAAPWLSTWYENAALREALDPCLVEVLAADGQTPLMLLPLAIETEGRLRIARFADAGITDYNAPLLMPQAEGIDCGLLLDALRETLPAVDMFDLDKMPERIGVMSNPFAALPQARRARLSGNVIVMPGSYADYLSTGLNRFMRKELGRCQRNFEAQGGTFRLLRDASEALHAMDRLETLQRAHILASGRPYGLDEPANHAHYRALVEQGLETGNTVLSILEARGEVVAALLGIRHGQHYAMVRLAQGGGEWSTVSPGRMVITRTMEALRAQGVTLFDFTIGTYDYKRRLGAEPLPLFRLRQGMSLRGRLFCLLAGLKDSARNSPLLRRLLGKPSMT